MYLSGNTKGLNRNEDSLKSYFTAKFSFISDGSTILSKSSWSHYIIDVLTVMHIRGAIQKFLN